MITLLLRLFLFFLLISPILAAESDKPFDSVSPSHITKEIPHDEGTSGPVTLLIHEVEETDQQDLKTKVSASHTKDEEDDDDLEQGDIYQIETIEDAENASCAIWSLRTARAWWTMTTGFFDFFGGLGNTAKTALVTLSTLGEFTPETRRWLGLATTFVSVSALISNKLADTGLAFAIANQKELLSIKKQIDAIHAKYQDKTPHLKIKSATYSKEDQTAIVQLQKNYNDITSLTGCEKGCFAFSTCFLRNTRTFSEVMKYLCNTGNIILVPLATIPDWDPTITTALGVTAVFLEFGSSWFNQLAIQAKNTDTSMRNLKKDLNKLQLSN